MAVRIDLEGEEEDLVDELKSKFPKLTTSRIKKVVEDNFLNRKKCIAVLERDLDSLRRERRKRKRQPQEKSTPKRKRRKRSSSRGNMPTQGPPLLQWTYWKSRGDSEIEVKFTWHKLADSRLIVNVQIDDNPVKKFQNVEIQFIPDKNLVLMRAPKNADFPETHLDFESKSEYANFQDEYDKQKNFAVMKAREKRALVKKEEVKKEEDIPEDDEKQPEMDPEEDMDQMPVNQGHNFSDDDVGGGGVPSGDDELLEEIDNWESNQIEEQKQEDDVSVDGGVASGVDDELESEDEDVPGWKKIKGIRQSQCGRGKEYLAPKDDGEYLWQRSRKLPHVKEYRKHMKNTYVGSSYDLNEALIIDGKAGRQTHGFLCDLQIYNPQKEADVQEFPDDHVMISNTVEPIELYYGIRSRLVPQRRIEQTREQLFKHDFLNLKICKIQEENPKASGSSRIKKAIQVDSEVQIGQSAILKSYASCKPLTDTSVELHGKNIAFMRVIPSQFDVEGSHDHGLMNAVLVSRNKAIGIITHVDNGKLYATRFDCMQLVRNIKEATKSLSSCSAKPLRPTREDAKIIIGDIFLTKEGEDPVTSKNSIYIVVKENLQIQIYVNHDKKPAALTNRLVPNRKLDSFYFIPGKHFRITRTSSGLNLKINDKMWNFVAHKYDTMQRKYLVDTEAAHRFLDIFHNRTEQYFDLNGAHADGERMRMGENLKYYCDYIEDKEEFICDWLKMFSTDKSCLKIVQELYGTLHSMPDSIREFFTKKTLDELYEDCEMHLELVDSLSLKDSINEAEQNYPDEFYNSFAWYEMICKAYGNSDAEMKKWMKKFLSDKVGDDAVFKIMLQFAITKGSRPHAISATYQFVDIASEVNWKRYFDLAIQRFKDSDPTEVFGMTMIELFAYEKYADDSKALFKYIETLVEDRAWLARLAKVFMKGHAANKFAENDKAWDDLNQIYHTLSQS